MAETGSTSLRWYVLWTRSNCEQLVHDQLAAKGFRVFLPMLEGWSRRSGLRLVTRVPMFRGYLFLHDTMDKATYVEVYKTTGLVRVLGQRWNQLATVSEDQIEAIQRVARSGLKVLPHLYFREGQRVRVTGGPLANVEGVLMRSDARRGLLVVSIDMLRRSIAVEVDCTLVEAA